MHRRSLLTAAALLPLATACGQGASPNAPSSPAGPPFRFNPAAYPDVRVELDRPARRVVADIYSAAALQPYGITPVGVWGYGHDDTGKGDLDLAKLNVLGLDAELSLEKLAAARPDVIIGVGNTAGNGWTWWDDKVQAQAAKIAPFVPIQMTGRKPDQMIAEYAALASALGADTQTPAAKADQKAFDDALARVKEVASRKRDLTVLPLTAEVDKVYTSDRLGVVRLLTEAGVTCVGPKPEGEKVWATSSWETIGNHPADVVLLANFQAATVQELPLYRRLPAVGAGQTMLWNDKRAYVAKTYAAWLNEFADLLGRSQNIVS